MNNYKTNKGQNQETKVESSKGGSWIPQGDGERDVRNVPLPPLDGSTPHPPEPFRGLDPPNPGGGGDGNSLRDSWIFFLNEISEKIGTGWQIYATLTFHYSKHPEQAIKQLKRFKTTLNNELFTRRQLNRGYGLTWAIAQERQDRGVIHYHCLIGGDERLTTMSMNELGKKWWNQGLNKQGKQTYTGLARFTRPKKDIKVRSYIAKYVNKTQQGMEIIVPARLRRRWKQLNALRFIPVA
jgi:hypothetical protein